MNAPYTDLFEEDNRLDPAVTTPFPNSRKAYVTGHRDDIKVAMREVDLAASAEEFGGGVNPPVPIYDTSGPYTDPDIAIDIHQGLAPLRQAWINERGDTETLSGAGAGAVSAATPQPPGPFRYQRHPNALRTARYHNA